MLRKGQAASAATLIAIIAGLILLYILFIPQSERDKILGEEGPARPGAGSAAPTTILLREKPGTIFISGQREVEHDLPSFNLFTRKEDIVIKSLESLKIESSKGTASSRKLLFALDDPENTENGLLSFDVVERSGRLIIRLNGQEILNEEVKGSRVLNLDKALFKESNEIEFATLEVPFWQFWAKNAYDMRNIKIIATILDVSNREATQTFFLTENEAGNIERASLVFSVECSPQDAGKLTSFINGAKVASAIPDCGQLARYTLNPEDLQSGTNELRFSTEKGTFLIDRVIVRTHLKEAVKPIFFFEVSPQNMKKIRNDTQAILTLSFVDDGEEKMGVINVNGHKTSFDTRKPVFTKDISSMLQEGNNYVQIEPKVTLNVVELRVELKKK